MSVNTDEFMMWRAVFAFALSDGVLSLEDQHILTDHLRSVKFSRDQLDALKQDMDYPQDVNELYGQIQGESFKQRFCELARTLAWSDGDASMQEKEMLRRAHCLKNKDNSAFVSSSATSPWMKDYIARYEEMAFLKKKPLAPVFDMRA